MTSAVTQPASVDGLAVLGSATFRTDVERQTARWDDEWLSYMVTEREYAHQYFINRRQAPAEPIDECASVIRGLAPREFFVHKPLGYAPFCVWLRGEWVAGARIAELGCGPGMLGKAIAPFCSTYLGLDYSKLALHIARLTSPVNCTYLHLESSDELARFRGTLDLCVGRYFFIHQNLTNAIWILGMFRDLLRPGGRVSADFFARRPATVSRAPHWWRQARRYWRPDSVVHENTWMIRDPEQELMTEQPSCMYEYSDSQIQRLAAISDFTLESIDYEPDLQRRFAIFRKP